MAIQQNKKIKQKGNNSSTFVINIDAKIINKMLET